MLTIHNLIYSRLKQVKNRDLSQRKTADWSGKHGRSTFENNFVYESKIDLICTAYGNQCSTHCCSQSKSKNMHSMLERETAAGNKLIWGKDCRETQREREKSANLYHCLMRPMASHPTQKKTKKQNRTKSQDFTIIHQLACTTLPAIAWVLGSKIPLCRILQKCSELSCYCRIRPVNQHFHYFFYGEYWPHFKTINI